MITDTAVVNLQTSLQTDADAALQTATDVVTVPGYALRNLRVDARREEECTRVADAGHLACQQHDKTNQSVDIHGHHEKPTIPQSVSEESATNAEQTCHHIWRHGHQLRCRVRISEVSDDGWQKKRHAVKRRQVTVSEIRQLSSGDRQAKEVHADK